MRLLDGHAGYEILHPRHPKPLSVIKIVQHSEEIMISASSVEEVESTVEKNYGANVEFKILGDLTLGGAYEQKTGSASKSGHEERIEYKVRLATTTLDFVNASGALKLTV